MNVIQRLKFIGGGRGVVKVVGRGSDLLLGGQSEGA